MKSLQGARDPLLLIRMEIDQSSSDELTAYLHGASRDGTFNRQHRTWRIAQRDHRWLRLLQRALNRLGTRSWIYREGRDRHVWVLETTWDFVLGPCSSSRMRAAFCRGYFDAEGGIPRRQTDRFYVQISQKNRSDLARLGETLNRIGVPTGILHHPSKRVDPDYWRISIPARGWGAFARIISSWHPIKRRIFEQRFGILAEYNLIRHRAKKFPGG
jgi:LAGLIDADG-like domain